MAYKKETDYQALINQAVAEGNYTAAAAYEQQRNEKIAGEGMSQAQTNKYAQYLPQQSKQPTSGLYDVNTDYKGLLDSAMKAGSTDADYLQGLLNSRMAKVQDDNYARFDDPNYHAYVQEYINNLKGPAIDLDSIMAQISSYTGAAPQFQSQWDPIKDRLAQEAIGMSYDDFLKGDRYSRLSDRYAANGRRAMQDVLGQMSARTGGLASSYAEAVAQQQYNDYMSRLEDAAQSMYNAERGDALQNAQLALSMADNDYGRYQDQIGQYNQDRNFVASMLGEALSQQQSAEARRLEMQDRDYDQALDKAKTLASAGDYSGYGALGYTDEEVAKLQKAYDDAQAQAAAKAYRGNGGGSDKGKEKEDEDIMIDENAGTGDKDQKIDLIKVRYLAKQMPAQFAYNYLEGLFNSGQITGDQFLQIFEKELGYNVDNFRYNNK